MEDYKNSPRILAAGVECNGSPRFNSKAVVLGDNNESSKKHEEIAKNLGLSEGESSGHLNFKFLMKVLIYVLNKWDVSFKFKLVL